MKEIKLALRGRAAEPRRAQERDMEGVNSMRPDKVRYCENLTPCSHPAKYEVELDRGWQGPRLLRFICALHVDDFCNHGWLIPVRKP